MPQIFEVPLVHSHEISLNGFDSLLLGHLEVHPSSNGSRGYFPLRSSLAAPRHVANQAKLFHSEVYVIVAYGIVGDSTTYLLYKGWSLDQCGSVNS